MNPNRLPRISADVPSLHADPLTAAARGAGLTPLFQPIVSLIDRRVVGYEALARWPALPIAEVTDVFARAALLGEQDSLDEMCATAAISAALGAGLGAEPLLLLNTEPDSAPTVGFEDAMALGHDALQIMFELTERNLLTHPHAMLHKLRRLRAAGFAVALDDVGANPHSLALLDVIAPDMVKLDLELVQAQPHYEQARTLSAVLAHHERTGVTILAEGIETERHWERAIAWGATLGQGFLFGGAEPLPTDSPVRRSASPPRRSPRIDTQSAAPRAPFDMVAQTSAVRTASKDLLTELSHYVETLAMRSADQPMVLTALQRDRNWTAATRRRYHEIACNAPLVVVFAAGIDEDLGCGVRGVSISPADALADEWTIVVLGAHTATALIARERYERPYGQCSDADRMFDFAVTYDRDVVTTVARSLLDLVP